MKNCSKRENAASTHRREMYQNNHNETEIKLVLPPLTTESVTIISPSANIPPPPIPWTDLPASLRHNILAFRNNKHSYCPQNSTYMIVKLVATAHMIAPRTNKNDDKISKFFLPKTWLNPEITG